MIGRTQHGDVTLLTLRRPERRNALDLDHCRALREAIVDTAEEGARAVVVTGEGSSFCSGADLDGVYGDEFVDALYAMLRTVAELPVPVVAAVNGPAIGAGTQLAIACDLRVAAPTALFGVPTAKNGLAVDAWTMRALAALAGGGTARAMMLGCEMPDVELALRRGLADRAGGLDDALSWAAEIASWAPLTLAYNKLVLRSDPRDPDADEQIARGWSACWASDDVQEAQQARRDKRAPVFRGR